MEPDVIVKMIQAAIPDAEVQVRDLTGTRDHFSVTVVSQSFEGEFPVKRHRKVNAALAEPLQTGEIHALQLNTYTPTQWAQINA
jgi:stress-induced morphogen